LYSSLTNENATSSLPHLPIGMPLHPVKGFDSHLRAKSNQEIVANRQDLRIANINAAQLLKAELSSSGTAVSTDTSIYKNLNSSHQYEISEVSNSSIKQNTVIDSDKVLSTSVKLASKRKVDEIEEEIPTTTEEGDVKDDDNDLPSVPNKEDDRIDSIR